MSGAVCVCDAVCVYSVIPHTYMYYIIYKLLIRKHTSSLQLTNKTDRLTHCLCWVMEISV